MTIHYSLRQLFGLNVGPSEALWRKWARAAIIALIAGALLLAAIGKLLDNRYFAEILAQWRLFPNWSLLGFGVLLSLCELLLALWLFSGWRLAEAALFAVLFHISYVLGTLVTVLRGIRLPDCGCFGILFPHPLDWMMVFQDAALAVLCIGLFFLARSKRSPTR
jgi:hypothetical protein